MEKTGIYKKAKRNRVLRRSVAILFAILFTVLLLCSCDDGGEILLDKAEGYLQQDNLEAAYEALQYYLEKYPNDLHAKELQAEYYHKTDSFRLEAETYLQLLRLAGENKTDAETLERYYLACGDAYLAAGADEDALEMYEAGIAALPASASLMQRRDAIDAKLNPIEKKPVLASEPLENGFFPLAEPGDSRTIQLLVSGVERGEKEEAFAERCEKFSQMSGHTVQIDYLEKGTAADVGQVQQADLVFIKTTEEETALQQAGLLVALETIQEQYPDFGFLYSGEKLLSASEKPAAVLPLAQQWTALFYRKDFFEEEKRTEPTQGAYFWYLFLNDCEAAKQAGKTPIVMNPEQLPIEWLNVLLMQENGERKELADCLEPAFQRLLNLYEKDYTGVPAYGEEPLDALKEGKAVFYLGTSAELPLLQDAIQAGTIGMVTPPIMEKGQINRLTAENHGCFALTETGWQQDKRDICVSLLSYLTTADAQSAYAQPAELLALKTDPRQQENGESVCDAQTDFVSRITGCSPQLWERQLTLSQQTEGRALLRQVLDGKKTPEAATLELSSLIEREKETE